MAFNMLRTWCVSDVKHEGESVGKYKGIGGSKFPLTHDQQSNFN